MPNEQVVEKLEQRYPNLEQVDDAVFRGVDEHNGHPFAIRYFDLNDDLLSAAEQLHKYQDRLLGISYFDAKSKADLRWNHYLYFVTTTPRVDKEFLRAKALVESNREYARKIVVTEQELDNVIGESHFGVDSSEESPTDPLSIWVDALNKHNLGFIVDEKLQVPAIVRHIADGERRPVLRPPAKPQLDPAEEAVSGDSLANIKIRGFRAYPVQKTFDFGVVNLILGVNGAGKTSLLEAIEYLFCGKTRRMDSVLPRTVVSGSLTRSNLILQTKSATSKSRLRSRHLVWYGKSELKTLTLQDSFSKFNFLDTDAAVRLSVEKSRERISNDLAQLLLGAEASKALDRFARVANQLAELQKSIQKDIKFSELSRTGAAERLSLLREAPQESDSLFIDLVAGLRDAGWLEVPSDKRQSDHLAESIQSALVNLAILNSVGHTDITDSVELDAELQKLVEAKECIDRLSAEEQKRKRDDARSRRQLKQVTQRLKAFEALAQLIGTGVNELHSKRQSLQRQLNQHTVMLADAEAAVHNLPSETGLRQKMLASVALEWTEFVQAAKEKLAEAKNAMKELELTQNVLSSLRQRLRSTAQEIIQHTGNATHCPLCQAEYSEAVLRDRLEHLTRGLVAAESDSLQSELRAAESLHEQRLSELTALRALEHYLQSDSVRADSAKTSLGATIRRVTNATEHVAGLLAELNSVENTLQAHEEKGQTFQRLTELASRAGIVGVEVSSDELESARAGAHDEQKRLIESINSLETQAQEAAAQTTEIGITYGLDNPTVSELAQTISERKKAAEDQRRAIAALQNMLALATTYSTSDLEARLREAQGVARRLRTAIAKEQQNTEAVQRESELISRSIAEIEDLRARTTRVDNALSLLDDLLSRQSARVLAETVLRENAVNIANTFAKIHAPNEFDLTVLDDNLTIMRQGAGDVSLNEMSSGQRAAYALSLFLAMNERLTAGPKILLLDDPVAHVDDINTLSLLDHLRDIALSGQRQIFFATANAKIGALFGRKFRFLGDNFVQIALTRE